MIELETLCKERGLRLTQKRKTVCQAFLESGDHPSVEQIYARAIALDPKLSRGTVYRTMNILREAGVLSQRWFGDRRARYEEAGGEHHHLIDTGSGRVIEFASPEIEQLKRRIAEEFGYRLTSMRLEFFGEPEREVRVAGAKLRARLKAGGVNSAE